MAKIINAGWVEEVEGAESFMPLFSIKHIFMPTPVPGTLPHEIQFAIHVLGSTILWLQHEGLLKIWWYDLAFL